MKTENTVDPENLETDLALGIKFYLHDAPSPADPSADKVTWIPGSMGAGPVGDKAKFLDATTIDMTGYKSKAAPAEPEDREIKFKYLKKNTAQDKLREAAKKCETRKVSVEFPPIGKKYIYEMAFGGWQMDEPEFNTELTMTVFARKNTSFATIEEDITPPESV